MPRSSCAGIDEYMRGTGRLLRAGVEKIWGPGRHLAGNNTFSYFLDPHGNTVEYTTELEQVDEDTWHPHLYDFTQPEVADQWGTANQMNEFVAAKSFNDPDRGMFVAPPSLMRFATFSLDGRVQAGVVSDVGVHPLTGGHRPCCDLVRGRPAGRAGGRAAGPGRRRPCRWRQHGCCRRWTRRRSGTSSPSKSTSRAWSPASATARA